MQTNLDMLGKELDRRATEITFSVSFWENKPQYCSFSLEGKLKCLKGVIMRKSENLPAFCNQKGQVGRRVVKGIICYFVHKMRTEEVNESCVWEEGRII